jgi:hypothetical protein
MLFSVLSRIEKPQENDVPGVTIKAISDDPYGNSPVAGGRTPSKFYFLLTMVAALHFPFCTRRAPGAVVFIKYFRP